MVHGRRQFLLAGAGAILAPRISAAIADGPRTFTSAQAEKFLREGSVIRSKTLGVGITHSMRLTLSLDGVVHDAHRQTIDESKSQMVTDKGTELNFRDCWKFNLAAYRLDAMLGLNMTPPSVARSWSGSIGAFTWWIPDAIMEVDRRKKKITPPDLERFNQEMHVTRVFDQLIFNTDRNLQNLLTTPDGRLWMIDHTRCFRLREDLLAPKNLAKIDRRLLASLKSLERKALRDRMEDVVRPGEIDGLLRRRDRIVAYFEKKINAEGAEHVLYDMPQRPEAWPLQAQRS